MNDFSKKYKKVAIGITSFWLVLLVLFIVNLVFSLNHVNNYTLETAVIKDSTLVAGNWGNPEIQDLLKEKLWLEQQLLLAKTDSFSLGINLKDSIVQVQLKGTVLFQAKILEQSPKQFFQNTGKETYFNVFGDVSRINSGEANTSKRPIKKVVAPPIGTEKPVSKADSVIAKPIHWIFTTSNQNQVVINGVQQNADSTFNVSVSKDLFNYRLKHGFSSPFSKKYTATLFLWINDNDAKSIYRALPEQSKFIFRN